MQSKKLIVAGVAAVCLVGAAYATAAVRAPARPAVPVSRAVQIRSQYNPFALQRNVLPPAAVKAAVLQRVAGTVVRPPYRPPVRSPYQPPVRGPFVP